MYHLNYLLLSLLLISRGVKTLFVNFAIFIRAVLSKEAHFNLYHVPIKALPPVKAFFLKRLQEGYLRRIF
jgi:hypothetical protein